MHLKAYVNLRKINVKENLNSYLIMFFYITNMLLSRTFFELHYSAREDMLYM